MLEINIVQECLVFSLVKCSLMQGPDSRVDFFKFSFHSCSMLYVFMQVQPTMF